MAAAAAVAVVAVAVGRWRRRRQVPGNSSSRMQHISPRHSPEGVAVSGDTGTVQTGGPAPERPGQMWWSSVGLGLTMGSGGVCVWGLCPQDGLVWD